jgi:hypothetical protein
METLSLYHYCSLQSFFGIVNSDSLHLSLSKYSNDPNESKIGENVLKKIFNSDIEEKEKNLLQNAIRIIESKQFNFFENAFVFCMSEKVDDLNQWRIYSDNGRGVVLKINSEYYQTKKIDQILDKEFLKGPRNDELYLDKCIYDMDSQVSLVKRLVKIFSLLFLMEALGKDTVAYSFLNYLSFISAFFKNESFKDENEWRLICFPIIQQHINQFKYKISYKIKRSVIIPYVEMPIESKNDKILVDKVVLGGRTVNTPNEILNFINNCNFKVNSVGRTGIQIQEFD